MTSIATTLLARSDTDLISGRTRRMATSCSAMSGDASAVVVCGGMGRPGGVASAGPAGFGLLSAFCSNAGPAVAVVRASAAGAVATCSGVVAACRGGLVRRRRDLRRGGLRFSSIRAANRRSLLAALRRVSSRHSRGNGFRGTGGVRIAFRFLLRCRTSRGGRQVLHRRSGRDLLRCCAGIRTGGGI